MTTKLNTLLVFASEWPGYQQFVDACRKDDLANSVLDMRTVRPEEATPEDIDWAEVCVATRFNLDWLKCPKQLKWIQSLSAGIEEFLTPDMLASDIILTTAAGVHEIPISEHVLGMMLMFARGLHRSVRQQVNHEWKRNGFGKEVSEIFGATVGIIGLGSIGEGIARRAKALGMDVIATRRHPDRKSPSVDVMLPPERLTQLLEESDYLVISSPLTPETFHMIGESELRQMKPGSVIINIARGAIIDQDALIQALKEGWIAGAGLDATDPEPLPPDSPLWDMPNVIISPHVAGLNPKYGTRAGEIFVRNLHAYVEGEIRAMINVVDRKLGY